jgi:DNA-binding IclR family transcriptional regulator
MLATSGYGEVVAPTARRLANHFGETVHVAAWDRGLVMYVVSERPPRGVAAPAVPVAACSLGSPIGWSPSASR